MPRSLLLAACLLAPLSAPAATPIDETRPLDPRGEVEIENVKGRIEVRAWDRPEVKITGSLGAGVEKLEIEGDRQRLEVRVRYPRRFGLVGGDASEPSELRLMVPLLASLDISSVAADVDVQGIGGGELSIDSVSGDVVAVGAPRKAEIDSVSGDQTLTLNSDDIRSESVSGNIRLRGRMAGEVSLTAVSGDVDLANRESRLRKLTGSTVSGDMRAATALAADGKVALETVSGGIVLNLPRDLSATVHGETFSGDISATGATIQRPEHGPGASFSHRYGAGGGSVTVETFSGDARIVVE